MVEEPALQRLVLARPGASFMSHLGYALKLGLSMPTSHGPLRQVVLEMDGSAGARELLPNHLPMDPMLASFRQVVRGRGWLLLLVWFLLVGVTTNDVGAASLWVPTEPVRQQTFQDLDLFGDGTGYAFVPQDLQLKKTSDFGMSWQEATSPPGSGPVAFADPGTGYAIPFGSDGPLLRTTDGAGSWSEMSRPPASKAYGRHSFLALYARDELLLVGGTQFPRSQDTEECVVPVEDDMTIWFSVSAGRRWKRFVGRDYGTPFKLEAHDRRRAIAIVYDGFDAVADPMGSCLFHSNANSVYLTKDGGKSWGSVLTFEAPDYASAIQFIDKRTILVGTNDGRLLRSEDAGRTFEVTHSFPHEARAPVDRSVRAFWVAAIEFANRRVGYLSTKGSGTYRTDDGGKTWTLELSHEIGWGIGAGDLAVADEAHAITGGPSFISTRVP